jgi:type IV secretory pathway TrbD component
MGVLSALPVISIGNLCCCLWVITGGVVAAYLLQQNQSTPISAGDGATVGLLAGLFGAVVSFVISIPLALMLGPVQQALAERVLSMGAQIPPQVREVLENAGRSGSGLGFAAMLAFQAIGFFFTLCAGAIFSTLGGLLGAAIFAKKPAAPAPL